MDTPGDFLHGGFSEPTTIRWVFRVIRLLDFKRRQRTFGASMSPEGKHPHGVTKRFQTRLSKDRCMTLLFAVIGSRASFSRDRMPAHRGSRGHMHCLRFDEARWLRRGASAGRNRRIAVVLRECPATPNAPDTSHNSRRRELSLFYAAAPNTALFVHFLRMCGRLQ